MNNTNNIKKPVSTVVFIQTKKYVLTPNYLIHNNAVYYYYLILKENINLENEEKKNLIDLLFLLIKYEVNLMHPITKKTIISTILFTNSHLFKTLKELDNYILKRYIKSYVKLKYDISDIKLSQSILQEFIDNFDNIQFEDMLSFLMFIKKFENLNKTYIKDIFSKLLKYIVCENIIHNKVYYLTFTSVYSIITHNYHYINNSFIINNLNLPKQELFKNTFRSQLNYCKTVIDFINNIEEIKNSEVYKFISKNKNLLFKSTILEKNLQKSLFDILFYNKAHFN